jgi:hypothetical protein
MYFILYLFTQVKMWLQQAPSMSEKLMARVRESAWILEKSSDNGDSVFVFKSPKKVFMISVRQRTC